MRILWFNAGTSMLSTLIVFISIIALYFLLFGLVTTHNPAVVGLGVLIAVVGWLVLIPIAVGVAVATAAESLKERRVSLGYVIKRAFGKLLPVIGLTLLLVPLMFIGFLLLIVPGIILIARSSLACLIIFEEDLGPIKALKRSFALTKGHAIEMLGSLFAGYMMSGSYLLGLATGFAPFVGRYEGLKKLEQSHTPKPKTHWLNYLGIVLPMLLITGCVLLGVFLSVNAVNQVKKQAINSTSSALTNNEAVININSVPYCGTVPTATMSAATLSLVAANMALNNELYAISKNVISENYYQQPVDIQGSLAADHQLLAALQAIPYPSSATQDAAVYETDIQNYDKMLTQELQQFPNISSIQDALTPISNSRDQAANKLRQDLGIPQSTCGFYSP
jgi:hypothetical protein